VRVAADEGLVRGRAWLPMHWGEQFMNGYGANALMPSAVPILFHSSPNSSMRR
jgi:assimilatory nitrate reductase catalytic subunit